MQPLPIIIFRKSGLLLYWPHNSFCRTLFRRMSSFLSSISTSSKSLSYPDIELELLLSASTGSIAGAFRAFIPIQKSITLIKSNWILFFLCSSALFLFVLYSIILDAYFISLHLELYKKCFKSHLSLPLVWAWAAHSCPVSVSGLRATDWCCNSYRFLP